MKKPYEVVLDANKPDEVCSWCEYTLKGPT